jgi:uncharacterized protein YjbI with pentapeptide repeats
MADKNHLKIFKQGVEGWNRWRRDNPDIEPNLSGANFYVELELKIGRFDIERKLMKLRGIDLSRTDLTRIQAQHGILDGADLSHAVLAEANLSGASLVGANLTATSLWLSDLTEAILTRADLSRSYLKGVNLSRARLREVNFSEAIFADTILANSDLSTAKGLDTAHHRGPSIISIDTIFESKGNIPQVFLRGCGVPEDFITYMPSLVAGLQPIQFYSCFISYSHADKSFARRLYAELQARGIRCWLDEHQLLLGDKMYTEVDRGIRTRDKVLLCCSEGSLNSWWVDKEITIAIEEEEYLWKQRGKEVLKLIPLNLDGYLFTDEWKNGRSAEIKSRLAADFTGWEADNSKFEAEFEKLVRSLRADAGGRESPPLSRL